MTYIFDFWGQAIGIIQALSTTCDLTDEFIKLPLIQNALSVAVDNESRSLRHGWLLHEAST